MMAKQIGVSHIAVTLGLTAILSGCGGSGSGEPEPLVCVAPQVKNDAGTACVDPAQPQENTAPEITSADQFSVEENTPDGTVVYTADGSDSEDDQISWSLKDDENIFTIGSSTGQVSVADSSKLLAANLTDYNITLTATDNGSPAKSSSLQIRVDVQEAVSAVKEPSVKPSASQGVIYYHREEGDYTGWILHAWNNETCDGYADFASDAGTEWDVGLTPTGFDDNYGAYWLFDTKSGASCVNYIIHKGGEKDPNDNDQTLTLSGERWVFAESGVGLFDFPEQISTEKPLAIKDAEAHLIDANVLLTTYKDMELKLVWSESGELDEAFDASNALVLTATSLSSQQQAMVPHLSDGWTAYTFDATEVELKNLLKQQLVVAKFEDDKAIAATYVQTAKALDAVYTSGDNDADEVTDLGVNYSDSSISVKTWAPTARDVKLKVYNASKSLVATHEMTLDDDTGIWSYKAEDKAALDRLFYRFEVTVYHPVTRRVETTEATDPYSVNTSTNGRYSQFVNMLDDDLKPDGWGAHLVPSIENIEDGVILEAHIRDFSINDKTTSEANRGKYLAFSESGTDANNYLSELATSGVTHFHMLPANDIATIEEDATKRIDLTSTVSELCARVSNAPVCGVESGSDTLEDVLAGFDPASDKARDLINSFRGLDGFNWGYDPHHFNVVEGSYASDPDGVARIKEFREMVQALHGQGLRVVLDVVYNHTSSSGLYDNSVFDKLVPGYYHRYSEITGEIERSTCCENTATEHKMMAKFVVDSLVHWAQHYGLDGFRFDVMGHMPKGVILDGREAVADIDPDTYFYGEGWNWGEVENNRLFEQATQYNLASSQVGTFNDRPRDTIRGAALSRDLVNLNDMDHIRLGLAGTLQNFELVDQNGIKQKGIEFGQSSYALDPADIINYVSKHDNETLWDNLQYVQHLPADLDSDTRVRIHSLSAAIGLVSQGIPFFQLGVDKLRSKSMDRNTYDAGDWFNRVDYTNGSNNWRVGYPIERGGDYSTSVSTNENSVVTTTQIEQASAVFNEFLQIRSSSPLFRLTTERDVQRRVGFHNTGPDQTKGLIVMSIDDGVGLTDLDEAYDALVVVINGTSQSQSHAVTSASGFSLHPVQQSSADTQVQTASFTQGDTVGRFSVPAHTIAVFVKLQGAEQGEGLAADPDYVATPYGEAELLATELNDSESLNYNDRGVYSLTFSATSGEHEFDITDKAGELADIAFADIDVATDSVAINEGANANFSVTIEQEGRYLLTLDVSDSRPVLAIKLQSAFVSCSAPESAGAAPFNIAGGGSLYVRGNHLSDWGADEEFKLTYIGDNQYKLVAEFDGAIQFKIASDDSSWSTQLWAQNSDGSIETAELQVGVEYPVAYDDAGQSNNKAELIKGTYSFLLTLSEANPSKGKNVGTLLIDQCN